MKMRAESEKYISIRDVFLPVQVGYDVKFKQANYCDVVLYKNLNYKIFNLSISLKAENLQSKKLFIDGVNLFNNRYSANVHLTIM